MLSEMSQMVTEQANLGGRMPPVGAALDSGDYASFIFRLIVRLEGFAGAR